MSARMWPGAPAAIMNDDTVRPARASSADPAGPAVQSDTTPPMRPRIRRNGSRSDSGGTKGWLLWIVTAPGYGGRSGQGGASGLG